MHPTAEDGFQRMLRGGRPLSMTERVLDIGGADVNGTVHQILRGLSRVLRLDVLDVTPGPGVTIVADATKLETWKTIRAEFGLYDLVITTETLEHVQEWDALVAGAARVLRPGGWFIGTCAGVGRRPHGARGEYDPPAGEWYANVSADLLIDVLADCFEGELAVEYSRRPELPTTCDLYWRAQVLPC